MEDELNEYLEATCVRCDDVKCQCCEEPPQEYLCEESNDDEYIVNLNDWD